MECILFLLGARSSIRKRLFKEERGIKKTKICAGANCFIMLKENEGTSALFVAPFMSLIKSQQCLSAPVVTVRETDPTVNH